MNISNVNAYFNYNTPQALNVKNVNSIVFKARPTLSKVVNNEVVKENFVSSAIDTAKKLLTTLRLKSLAFIMS